MNKFWIGLKGENAACAFLKKNGYRIISRNYRKSFGEIDIIAQKDENISFVEVKTRKSTEFGLPCQAVTKSKMDRIKKTAKTYIIENSLDENYSFDVIEIYYNGISILNIEHIKNAFY